MLMGGEAQAGCNVTVNLGGYLTRWRTAESGGAEPNELDISAPDGPNEWMTCRTSPKEWTITALIYGDDQTVRDGVYSGVEKGTRFTMANPPTGSSEMWIDGFPNDVGTVYEVWTKVVRHVADDLSEITVTLRENGVAGS